ncbi:MAG: hypothetical protein MJ176_10050 [Treponema sp.]|nr:hypothetical protein [Treponema sp.]
MKKNIVLIGMPSCGKTTVGRKLASLTSLRFVDSDEEIVKKAGKEITDIFAQDGEKAFRDLESQVIFELSKQQNIILSTGGGAILREENVKALKECGTVFFLDRPLTLLVPTSDRPLSSDEAALKKRYEERFDKYCAAGDFHIFADRTVDEEAAEILNCRRIEPSLAKGKISAPPSKSYAHRLLMCASLAQGKSIISNVAFSQDILATMDCMKAFGAEFEVDGSTVTVYGNGGEPDLQGLLKCRESGSTLRFMIPLAVIAGGGTLLGTEKLVSRGIGIYQEIFPKVNFIIKKGEINCNGKIESGRYDVKGNVSSQFITGLFYALPLLEGDSEVHIIPPVESRRYIDITVDVLARFGVEIKEIEENIFYIKGNQRYCAKDDAVEGDWSNAAFLFALNEMGGNVEVMGLNQDSLQGDKVCLQLFEKLGKPDAEKEPVDISGCPDLAPILFTVAAFKNGGHFTGTRRLAIKESDRGKVMAEELAKFGASVEVMENDVIVHKTLLHAPSEPLFGHNDHRIVMSMAVLSTVLGGNITGCGAVAKSYPDFFDTLEALNI